MASIAKRGDRWRARYRDGDGREHEKSFVRKADAQRWINEATAALVSGTWVDPREGKVTFRTYAERWRAGQVHRPSSAAHVETMLRRHAYPRFGDRALGSIRPTEIQLWIKGLPLAPSTVHVVHGIVSTIFRAALADRLITSSPCERSKLPRKVKTKIVPLAVEVVEALAAAVPPQYRALVILCAGTGMRQAEAFGLTLDKVNFLHRTIDVDRQLAGQDGGRPRFGPPKTVASVRTVPLPSVVGEALAEHVRGYGTGPDGLLFTDDLGHPLRRPWWSAKVWRPAVTAAQAPAGVGMHSLRHFYASLLIRHGESVKTVQSRLGHATAAETLDTYSHLWPDADDTTRTAVDSVLKIKPVAGTVRAVADH